MRMTMPEREISFVSRPANRASTAEWGTSIAEWEQPRFILLYQKVNDLYKTFFPEVYRDPKVETLDVYRRAQFAQGGFHHIGRRIEINLGNSLSDPDRMLLSTDYAGQPEFHRQVPRRIGELVIMSHEFGHGIFGELIDPNHNNYMVGFNGAIEFRSLEEGFSTIIGHAFLEQVIKKPELAGLPGFDQGLLKDILATRRSSDAMRSAPATYWQGIRIMERIYRDSDHTIAKEGNQGLLRIKEVLRHADPNILVDFDDEPRRSVMFSDLVGRRDPKNATNEWIAFVQDKKQMA